MENVILFVAELGSGFGHVRRLLPIARAAVASGFRARLLVSNPAEVATFVNTPRIELGPTPQLGSPTQPRPNPFAVATSFADILGEVGFADLDFLQRANAKWQAVLAQLKPAALVSEGSPFLLLATFGSSLPHLSVGHGFGLPPPELEQFPALIQGAPLYSETFLLHQVMRVVEASGRSAPERLPQLLAGTTYAVTGFDMLDPYRAVRRDPALSPPALDVELEGGATEPSEDAFVYLLGDAAITLPLLRALAETGASGRAYVRRCTPEQRAALSSSKLLWLERPEAIREALPRARLIVHHGSMLTSEDALVVGRPQFVAPLCLEHATTARALAGLGVVEVVPRAPGAAEIARVLSAALGSSSLQSAAAAAAGRARPAAAKASTLGNELFESVRPRPSVIARPAVSTEPAPWLSLIVPCYEMAPYLELTLQAIRELDSASVGKYEVVVVDDGSSDGIAAVVANAATRGAHFTLRSVRRERDARSCRSLARNLGAAESHGQYLLFLDAGVMPHPKLLTLLGDRFRTVAGAEEVLTLGTLGLFAAQLTKDAPFARERFRGLSAAALSSAFDSLASDPAWCERRQPWFDLVQGELSRLPAPWLLAWSSALGVPRNAFLAVSGFDESITTWGAEDCDLGLRLHRAGARFHAFRAPAALHVPHPISAPAERRANHLANLRRMHEKTFSREGELFIALEDPFAANIWALRLDRTTVERLLPSWDNASLLHAQHLLGSSLGVLFVGAPTPQLAMTFTGSTWAVPSRPLFESVARTLGASSAKLSVGCHSDEPTGARECMVLTDLLRLLPISLQIAQLKEATRVGKRALLFCIEPRAGLDESAIERELSGFAFAPLSSLRSAAESAGIRLAPVASSVSRLRAYSVETI